MPYNAVITMLYSHDEIQARVAALLSNARFRWILLVLGFLDILLLGAVFHFADSRQIVASYYLLLPLVGGMLVELFQLRTHWSLLLLVILISVFASTGAFLIPFLEPESISRWPYWFVAGFLFLSVLIHVRTIGFHRNELSCLVASLGLAYLIGEHWRSLHYISIPQIFGLALCVAAIAWLILGHSPIIGGRLWSEQGSVAGVPARPIILGIWNGVALLALTIYQLDQYSQNLDRFMVGELVAGIAWKSFLLGLSALYAGHNFAMVAGLFDDRWGHSILELQKSRAAAFSVKSSIFWIALLLGMSFFVSNLYFGFLAPIVAAAGSLFLLSLVSIAAQYWNRHLNRVDD